MRFLAGTRKKAAASLFIFVTALATLVAIPQAPAQALSGSDFQPGNIISDGIFFNGNALDAAGVRASLVSINTRNGVYSPCLLGVNGRRIPGTADPDYPSGNIIYASNCLEDYRETIPNLGGDRYCAAISGGNLSASEIIQRVGAACNVSQKVLIVLLEKEQSLVTDRFPSTFQYSRATGFNCPDTAPCVAASGGFFKQVYSAARRFQEYPIDTNYRYTVGQTVQVYFNPNLNGCGTGPVFIQNRATAALYYYTPYQPNAAALANLNGVGDSCSAYGNRNFWRMFNSWFGSSIEIPGSTQFITAAYNDVLGRSPDAGGLNYWIGTLAAGTPRGNIANFFNNSDEYYSLKITEAYNRALRRAPDPAGFNYWMGALKRGQLSAEDIYSTFLATDEMYFVQGGGTNTGYVTAMYRELLLRDPDAPGLAFWVGKLDRGEPRRAVSDSIWYSPEKYNVRVNEAYQKFLNRTANAGEQAYWSQIARQFGPTTMRAMIMSSDEYWSKADVRY